MGQRGRGEGEGSPLTSRGCRGPQCVCVTAVSAVRLLDERRSSQCVCDGCQCCEAVG